MMARMTHAAKLKELIAKEDEENNFQGVVRGMNLLPNTSNALRIFLESVHAHQFPMFNVTKKNECRCWMCETVRLMIEEFKT